VTRVLIARQDTKPFSFGKVLFVVSSTKVYFQRVSRYLATMSVNLLFIFSQTSVVADALPFELTDSSHSHCNSAEVRIQQQQYYAEHFGQDFYPKERSPHFSANDRLNAAPLPNLGYSIISTTNHSEALFTQGFFFHKGDYFESSGSLGNSRLYRYSARSGKLIDEKILANNIFAEGLTIKGALLYLISFKKGLGFVFNKTNFELVKRFEFDHEGWGITHFNGQLVISDGQSNLYRYDLKSFELVDKAEIRLDGAKLFGINEMEVIEGYIFANVWPTDCLVVIKADTTEVVAWVDLSKLYPVGLRSHWSNVANGIAFDRQNKLISVTGKNWKSIFVLKLMLNLREVQ
jgi:glutaminyl-peptide cyclotransferase